MASPTTPTHGKEGAIYRQRPNNFEGDGLNDVTWGTGYSTSASAYFEVEIDAEGTPDTFRWRKDGGTWNTGVSITGAAQTLSDGQTITFAATTDHTLGDKWAIGNLYNEACTESGNQAQITDSTKRLLNPNSPPTFTDSGGETVLYIDYTSGTAYFTGNVATVTVTGNNGYIVESGLEKVGYLVDWKLDFTLDMADASRMGQEWKEFIPGQADTKGSANGFFIGADSFFDALEEGVSGSQAYFLLELFNYDPDQDQTGDHYLVWAIFEGISVNAPLGELVKESISIQGVGIPSFVENV